MSFHAANIDDIRELDLAFERFSYSGHGVLHTMSRSIAETNELLEERLVYWENELNNRN